jgi:glycosyltransferase involved in cell wall biosynthesis
MLHSFPSMIHAAEAGKPLVTRPTRFEAQALERLGLVVTLGEHYPRMLAESRVEVVLAPPGVDEGWRRPPRPKAGRCRVVSVGSLTPRKGFLDAARVLGGRGGDDFEWHVVGSAGADAEYVRSVERAVHGCSNVRFWGQLPPAKTRELVLESDVLLMPSYDENHPLVLVEALAASVPPVAYAAGATSTIVRHERCGLVAPIGDLDGLAEHLDRVIRDEPFRFGLAEACFERQDELPTWQAAAEHARVRLAAVL